MIPGMRHGRNLIKTSPFRPTKHLHSKTKNGTVTSPIAIEIERSGLNYGWSRFSGRMITVGRIRRRCQVELLCWTSRDSHPSPGPKPNRSSIARLDWGNSCHAKDVFHCLIHIKLFTDFFISKNPASLNDEMKTIERESLSTQSQVLICFFNVIQVMHSFQNVMRRLGVLRVACARLDAFSNERA